MQIVIFHPPLQLCAPPEVFALASTARGRGLALLDIATEPMFDAPEDIFGPGGGPVGGSAGVCGMVVGGAT